MEKYDIKLYDLTRTLEIESVVFADEGELSDDIILKITFENTVITAKSGDYFPLIKSLEMSCSKTVLD